MNNDEAFGQSVLKKATHCPKCHTFGLAVLICVWWFRSKDH